MTVSEKISYIQGMFDGMDLDKSDSKEARILAEVLDVLKEIGDQLGLTRERVRQIREKSIAKLRDSGNARILMKYLG